ncbi:MAG: carboxypeptidase-like regulatory domain-containing protein [Candidatus Marinimicrobia bacterium]|nr:carboxypeptidase-like regulatory domain-containing protein [Candidatus Neomarinimicrobiota bacterium]
MKKIYIMLIIFLLESCVERITDINNQNELRIISGRIFDNYFNKGISGVNIKITPCDYSNSSDSLGYFVFKNIPKGKYLLTTESIYFLPDSTQLDLTQEDSLFVNITLTREIKTFYKLNFEIYEGYTKYESIEEPFVKANLATEESFGCSNLKILTNVNISSNQIDIEYLGATLIGDCDLGEGPATTSIPLQISSGLYNLYIKQQDIIDKYLLTVADTSIIVKSNGNNLLSEPNFTIYWRYPKNSYVLVGGTTTETQWIYNDFLALLQDSINLQEIAFPDYGKVCFPQESQGYYVDMPEKYFKYSNEEDFDKTGLLLNKYSKDVISKYSGVGIWICNWKNKKYYSWILNN